MKPQNPTLRFLLSLRRSFLRVLPFKSNEEYKFRYVYMSVFLVLALVANLLVDPRAGLITSLPFGAGLLATIVDNTKIIVYVGFFWLSGKALFDYIDLEDIYEQGKTSPEVMRGFLELVGATRLCITLIIIAVILA